MKLRRVTPLKNLLLIFAAFYNWFAVSPLQFNMKLYLASLIGQK